MSGRATAHFIWVMLWIPEGLGNADLPQILGRDQVALTIKRASVLCNLVLLLLYR